jgi:hypothetical protein
LQCVRVQRLQPSFILGAFSYVLPFSFPEHSPLRPALG